MGYIYKLPCGEQRNSASEGKLRFGGIRMKKRFFGFFLVLFALSVGFVFAIDANDLWLKLTGGEAAATSALNTLNRCNSEKDVEANHSRILADVNKAEDAILSAMNYEEVNGKLPTQAYQQKVNAIKANLRQIVRKLDTFGYDVHLGFSL